MDTQEEIKQLKERIAELEEQAKEEQEFPGHCDDYWFLSGGGTIDDSFYTDSHVDNKRLGMGNMFETRQQAQFALNKLKVEAELRKFSRPFLWGTENTAILFDGDDFKFDTRMAYVFQGVIYFESEKKAKQAIDAVGKDRVKKYIFGMEE